MGLTTEHIDSIVAHVPGGTANIQDIYPLAPLQEGILFHHLLDEKSDPYVLHTVLRFDSRYRVDAYVAALQSVVNRHDILRTSVMWEGLPEAAQVVWRNATIAVEEVSLDPSDGEIADQLSERFNPRRYRIDVRHAPMMHLALAPDPVSKSWVLVHLFHHLVLDHTTLEVVQEEIDAFLSGDERLLPAPLPFRTLIAHARRGVSREEQEAFFRNMLGGITEPTLAFGLSNVQGDGSEVEEIQYALDTTLTARVRDGARKLGVTPASLCHVAWATVLSVLCRQQDVVFGTVIFGRMQGGSGSDRAVGLFLNTLPLRLTIDGRGVERGVREAHEALAQLMYHEHASLALAQRTSGIDGSVPLFNSLLNYRHFSPKIAGKRRDGIESISGGERTNYPVAMSVNDFGAEMSLSAQMHRSIDAERVCRYMSRALEGLVEALERFPDLPLHSLQVLSEVERDTILLEWNATEATYPEQRCIHQLFEEQVSRSPGATAVEFDDAILTYAELCSRANQLARHLQGLGIGPGKRVALCFERSLDMLVGVFAALKAGAAFVPLDPAYPVERLSYMMKDSAACVVLTHSCVSNEVTQMLRSSDALLLNLVEDASLWANEPVSNPIVVDLSSRDLAYLIYTSGSTGRPKGVMVEHAGACNLAAYHARTFGVDGTSRVLQCASISFDAFVWEVVMTFSNGATMYVAPRGTILAGDELADIADLKGITHATVSPQALNGISGERLKSIHTLITAGDRSTRALVEKWGQGRRLFNAYGPTENTVCATAHLCNPGGLISPPIGKPIANVRTYILDDQLNPVPAGVAGELFIGGVQVARGYWNLPDLTAERFIPSPYVEGDRLYKTGDLARYLPDGNIEFLGRNDLQVKIRGFRIELGEIEANLAEYAGVHEALVTTSDDSSGEKRLVAYYLAHVDAPVIDAELLRAHLVARLPHYMVPSAFVRLEAMPLTPNGKIDLKALPRPDDFAFVRGVFEAPQGSVEQAIAEIWGDVLGVSNIGRRDNFFTLGGHSLLIVRVVERMRLVDLHADVRTLFSAPTLADIASVVRTGIASVNLPANGITANCEAITPDMLTLIDLSAAEIKRIVETVPGGAANVQDIYPLAPLQEGILFHYLLEGKRDPYLSYEVMRFDTRTRADRYLSALQAVIDRHDILRTAVVWDRLPEPVQVVWRRAPLVVEILNLDFSEGDIVSQLTDRYDSRSYRMDVRSAPLMRVALAEDAISGGWVLAHLFHHLALDHTTLEIVQREINAYLRGAERELEAPVPFRTLVAQARLGVGREEHEAFFRQMLGDVREPTLPFGLADVRGDGSEIASAYVSVDLSLTRRIREQARRLGVSMASVCHVAWARVLSVLSRRDDVVFGTVLFGRMHGGLGVDRAMGLFMNTLPLRLNIASGEVASTVRHTHEMLAQLMHHEHASLSLAQRCSSVAAPAPLFSALLNYRHFSDESVERARDGVQVLVGRERTNYPITLSVNDLGDEMSFRAQVDDSVDPTRLCGYMIRALEELVDALEFVPEMPLSAVAIIPDEERTNLLLAANGPQIKVDAERCIHELFEERASLTPDAPAILHGASQVSFMQLNTNANRLANYLREIGVKSDRRVALCFSDPAEMVPAILAVLKAAGTCVLLDPFGQHERVSAILAECGALVVLTQGAVESDMRAALHSAGRVVIAVDEQMQLWSNQGTENPSDADLASYHAALVNYARPSVGICGGGPFGRPLPNMRAYALDETLEPVPIGVSGTLFVGGDGLALGYWNRAALTSERFPGSPFVAGDRLYNTGEIAYVREDGSIDSNAVESSRDQAADASSTYEEPQGEIEQALASIWRELFGIERVGRGDNFFELGGHSLLVVRTVERMRAVGLHADVQALFTASTLAELALAVRNEGVEIPVPPNLVPNGAELITPEMLPMLKLSSEHINRIVGSVPGGAANIQDIYPLAPLQEGILFHHLLDDRGDPYLLHLVTRFDNRARVDNYIAAFQAVVDRHDILRTAVLWQDLPEPVQVVWRHAQLIVDEVVLDSVGGEIARELADRYDSRSYRLDVRSAPMIRLALAQDRSDGTWVLVHLFHHLVLDHTTLEIVQSEIDAFLRGESGFLPQPFPFRALVAHARFGVSREKHEAFFQDMLGDVTEPTFPFGLSDVQGDGTEIESTYHQLNSSIARRVRESARKLGVTSASICHVAWARVLASLSGRDDVVFGTVLFGRLQGGAGTERSMGLFMNTLPLRVRVGAMSVEQVVRRTHEALAQLIHHEHAPLSLALRCSGVAPPTPLFSSLLNYRHHSSKTTAQARAGIEVIGGRERTNYPITFSVNDLGEEMSFTAQVHTSVDARRLCAYMERALKEIADALELGLASALRSLSILPDAERQQVLVGWNADKVERALNRHVHEVFEEQVARTPDRTALIHGDNKFTFLQLNESANRLASHLRDMGVTQDSRIVLYFDHGTSLVSGLLAALKSGSTAVLVDSASVGDRLAAAIDEIAPMVILSGETCASALRVGLSSADVPVLIVDQRGELWAAAGAENVMLKASPAAPCFIVSSPHSIAKGLIGRPLPNSPVYVLDNILEPVPVGVSGDLYVGGDGLAIGYLEHAEVATDRFVPNPFVDGDRLYMTGHLARYLRDGNLEILERSSLPSFDRATASKSESEAPAGEIELALAQIWRDVLGIDSVGRKDNFFELGGHSLLVVQAIERMRKVGLYADVRSLFTASTLSDLALLVTKKHVGFVVPPNRIPPWATAITQEMLTLVELEADQLNRVVASVPGGVANIQDIYPLTPLQDGILFHHLLAEKGDPYLLHAVMKFDSRARLDAYVAALQRVIDRHDILRTSVLWQGLPAAVQIVWRRATLPVEEVALDSADGDVAQQLAARFDPRLHRLEVHQAPLMRMAIAHDAVSDAWILVHLFHHLVLDHTALEIVHHEIDAILSGEGDQLPEPLPFRNLVAQAHLESSENHEAFFRQMLADVTEPTLPFGLTDVQGDGSEVKTAYLAIDRTLAKRVRERARHLGVSSASICHVAWARVLSLVADRDDVVFGTVLFGRMQGGDGADRAMGLFLNTLPMRVKTAKIAADQSVRSTHDSLAQLMQHEHASLALAQRCSGVAAPAPLFTALFNYRHFSLDNVRREMPGIEVLGGGERTNYPFSMAVNDFGEEMSLTAQVHASVDAHKVCGYMQRSLEVLTRALEHAPSSTIDTLDVLPPAERNQVLFGWNRTEAAYPLGMCVHEVFEAQVKRTPDAIALSCDEEALTYSDLNKLANQLAHHLRGMGVARDSRITVCFDRSIEMIVSMLAVLKTGGAYVPLDPSNPVERLEYMFEDAASSLVLTHRKIAPSIRPLLSGRGVSVIVVDEETKLWADNSIENGCREGHDPFDLAYIIYTSGSTGKPKGVMVEHRSLLNLVCWSQELWPYVDGDSVLFKTPFAFDASGWELWWPLLSGAAVIVARPEGHKDGAYLIRMIQHANVTTLQVVPSMLHMLLEHQEISRCTSLTRVVCGGEALSAQAVTRFAQLLPNVSLYNVYGPTEATVNSTVWAATLDRIPEIVPIGRPLANTRAYVLNARHEPLPVGVAGELFIGGVQVARGYWNRPEMTSERFIASPFVAGDRLYKTGDIVRFNKDGDLEYLGRNDHQVKVRGFRIELGEIESAVRSLSGVGSTVVVARENASGEKRLIAYYTVVHGAEIGPETLRAHLVSHLPEYMVPLAYVLLETLPLNTSGKVDRSALPPPDSSSFASRAYEDPAGEIEGTIAGIWRELLNVDRVGRHDDFFALGGHSLLAVRVLSRIREYLGVELALSAIFSQPTLRELALHVALGSKSILPPILKVDRQDQLPLSHAQQRLWFLSHMDGIGSAYHVPMNMRLQGELDREALRHALDRIVARHEVLRTTFVSMDGAPTQLIASPATAFSLREFDLRGVADVTEQLETMAADEASAAFDLGAGPLFRGRLIRLASDDHVLMLTTHHIVSDGWSVGILVHELNVLYNAFLSGQNDPLAPIDVQYADYASWQRKWLDGDVLLEQSSYWEAQLRGAPGLLELPTDRPRPAVKDFDGASVAVEFDAALTARLQALSRKYGATLFMTVLAGFGAMLSRLSGQEEVVIGTPIANRRHAEVENLIGFFVNTLALRLDYTGEPTVSQALERVKRQSLQAQNHQDMPFEHVVELINPPRSMAHAPIFQVMFTWQNIEQVSLDMEGLSVTPLGAPHMPARFDLTLNLREEDGCIRGGLEYSTSLFQRETMQRYAEYLQRLLSGMVEADGATIAQLPLISPEERQLMVSTWNATEAAYPDGHCVHELFEQQAKRTPSADALAFNETRLTYADLNARANQLAHHLRDHGVRPDSRVALCFERSIEMMVSLLAVLKAGGAYVPLDPSYPVDRLEYMIADCAPSVILTHSAVPDAAQAALRNGNAPVIAVDNPESPWVNASFENPQRDDLTPAHLAYLIYTSGSTGQPKGVMVEHRNVTNLVQWSQDMYAMSSADVVIQKTPYSFDASIHELLWPLANGALLVLARSDGHKDAAYLAEVIAQHGITVLKLVPSLLHLLLETDGAARCSSLKFVISGGEALSGSVARRFREELPGTRLVDMYGPTETTVDVTAWPCDDDELPENIPIGRAVANTRTYIVDRYGEPVPMGVIGELLIGGVQVARGYWKRPALTAERFIASSFVPGDRLYKTGDLARYSSGGDIEYLGRNDFQVKIRGFRIELGEIESALMRFAGIRQALVIAREDSPGEKRLVAYYTITDESTSCDAEHLRTHLGTTLPDHMIPVAYVELKALPLTSTGKVDRKALPAPKDSAFSRGAYEAPESEVETALASIWSEVLGIERVGRNDNYFELGGHSLLVVRTIERMRKSGLFADVRTFFTAPKLADLARAIRREATPISIPPNQIAVGTKVITPEMITLIDLDNHQIEGITAAVPGGAENIQDIYPLMPLQEGMLFHYLFAEQGDPYLARTALRFDCRDRLDAYLKALDAVVQRHDILRTAIAWEGLTHPVQIVWRHAPLVAQELFLDPSDGEIPTQLAAWFAPETYRLDIRHAPMMKLVFAKDVADETWVLVWLTHQITLDSIASEIVQSEIDALLRGEEGRLVSPIPFRTLVAHARLSVSAEQHEEFFRGLLGDVTAPTLPFGLADVQGDGTTIDEAYYCLDDDLARRIRDGARRLGVSTASICHLAWARVLSALSGRDDVVFGTVLFGRMEGTGADRVVGLSLNTLPIRLRIDSTSVPLAIRQAHHALANIMRHEHAPLALAQRCSGVPAQTPLFSAILNYRHVSGEGLGSAREGIEELASRERTNYPVALAINDLGIGLSFNAQVDSSVDARRVCTYMECALESIVRALEHDPEKALSSIVIVPDSERDEILAKSSVSEMDATSHRCVHELFEERVTQTPDAIALECGESKGTYAELNAEANRLAHFIQDLGIGLNPRVVLYLKHGRGLITAVLAVLKAGGIFATLDPLGSYDYLASAIEEIAPDLIVTCHDVSADVRASLGNSEAATIILDHAPTPWHNLSAQNPVRGTVMPSDPACIILSTSQFNAAGGSIGRPTANTKAYILDKRRALSPIGAQGNLYIAGAGLALAPLGGSSHAMERFIPGPFEGERLYFVCEGARYAANGDIELPDELARPARSPDSSEIKLYEEPQGELETVLARIFSAILRVREVGRHDNFFELGGHSLSVVQVANRLRYEGLEANVSEIFRCPTVASLAARLKNRRDTGLPNGVVAVREHAGPRPLFLVHELAGFDVYFPVLAAHLEVDGPVYGLSAVPFDEPQWSDMVSLASRLTRLIRIVQPSGPYRLAGWSFGGVLAYEVARQLTLSGATVDFVGLIDAHYPSLRLPLKEFDPELSAKEELVRRFTVQAESDSQRQAVDALHRRICDLEFSSLASQLFEACGLSDELKKQNIKELEQSCLRQAGHHRALTSYVAEPISIPLHIFAAQDVDGEFDETLGWTAVNPRDRMRVSAVPGTHHSIMDKHVADLGRAMSNGLKEISLADFTATGV